MQIDTQGHLAFGNHPGARPQHDESLGIVDQHPQMDHYMTFFTGRHLQPVKLHKKGRSKEEKMMILYRALRRTVIRKEKQHFMFVLRFLKSLTTQAGPSARSQNQLRTHNQLRIYYSGLVQINRQKNALIGLMAHRSRG